MTDTIQQSALFTDATIENLLKGRLFVVIEGQILFFHEKFQTYVLTTINDEKNYTADDYMQLPEGAPFQLINSKLIYMASPFATHQKLSRKLTIDLGNYIESNRLGELFAAPLDVHFDEKNIVQPDLIFVSIKRSSIIQKWIYGAPDFLVEILSKSTDDIDRTKKMALYGKHDVVEYWIVNPEAKNIEVFHNQNKEMQLVQTAGNADEIKSKAVEGFVMKVASIFN
jgi:Uma2 family endonuclease